MPTSETAACNGKGMEDVLGTPECMGHAGNLLKEGGSVMEFHPKGQGTSWLQYQKKKWLLGVADRVTFHLHQKNRRTNNQQKYY